MSNQGDWGEHDEPSDMMATNDQPEGAEMDEQFLGALLSRPELWDEPDPSIEDAIVAAIRAEAATVDAEGEAGDDESVVSLDRERAKRRPGRLLQPLLTAVAGAVIAIVGLNLAGAVGGSSGPDGIELALAGTDLAPEAVAEANVVVGQLGTRIDLVVTGLAPAPQGTYYEAWLRKSPEVGVSAGTFHLRGGDGDVELWAGVDPKEYPLLTVTLQNEAQPESSGQVVLKGTLPTE